MFERTEATPHDVGRCRGDVPGPDGTSGHFEATDHGAQLLSWRPAHTGEDVLFCSERAVFQPTKAIRGGIPLCFPWFGAGRHGNKRPSHGFARISPWQLVRAHERQGITRLWWRFDETMMADLPELDRRRNNFEVEVFHVLGPELELTLRVRNTDTRGPLVFEEALHTYFTVGDVRRIEVHGLGGSEYLDQLTGEQDTQIGPITFPGEVDRIHQSAATVEIHDPVLGRRIVIAKENSASTIVWNPAEEKSRRTEDLGDEEWQRFVCIESGNIGSAVVHLQPGESHELRLRVSVLGLD